MRYGHEDPDLPPIGRQPKVRYITPSKPNPWYGTIDGYAESEFAQVGGARFTLEQQYGLACRGLVADTVETITAKRQATDREMWWPAGQLPPVFAFECPVVGRHHDGRLRVISPSGTEKLIREDGWTSWPKTKPRRIWN